MRLEVRRCAEHGAPAARPPGGAPSAARDGRRGSASGAARCAAARASPPRRRAIGRPGQHRQRVPADRPRPLPRSRAAPARRTPDRPRSVPARAWIAPAAAYPAALPVGQSSWIPPAGRHEVVVPPRKTSLTRSPPPGFPLLPDDPSPALSLPPTWPAQGEHKLGMVDGDRVGVTGWSYGGYMTTWLTGHYPSVWKAAVSGAAPTRLGDGLRHLLLPDRRHLLLRRLAVDRQGPRHLARTVTDLRRPARHRTYPDHGRCR